MLFTMKLIDSPRSFAASFKKYWKAASRVDMTPVAPLRLVVAFAKAAMKRFATSDPLPVHSASAGRTSESFCPTATRASPISPHALFAILTSRQSPTKNLKTTSLSSDTPVNFSIAQSTPPAMTPADQRMFSISLVGASGGTK